MLPRSAPTVAPRSTRERLDAAQRSPRFLASASHAPRQGFARGQALGDALGGVILPIGAVALIVKSLTLKTAGDSLAPLMLAIPAFGFGGWFAWRAFRFWTAPVERRVAIVVGDRLIERRHKGRTHYRYRVTLDTGRDVREWKTDRGTWDAARTGGAVVAFTRDEYLLELLSIEG